MKKTIMITIAITVIIITGGLLIKMTNKNYHVTSKLEKKTITYKSKDDVKITADLYTIGNDNAPFIILFHQAEYSRGEYLSIAPKLNALGYNCMAIDQRSGLTFNGVSNQTYIEAAKLNKDATFTSAYPDMQASLEYVKKNYTPKKLIIWGSSYSASLCLILFNEYNHDINGILAFSPGEYFTYEGKSISQYAKNITCPIFITSSKYEATSWEEISKAIPAKTKAATFFVPEGIGVHGSSALHDLNGNHQEYWDAVKQFLTDNF